MGSGAGATNGRVQRARAIDSTQVKTADRGLRLQPIVLPFYASGKRGVSPLTQND